MDGCLVQNMMDAFSEAGYYIKKNVNIMVFFDHSININAAALGLETLLRTQGNKSREYNIITVHSNHADADMICPSLKEPLDITDGLDLVVVEGFWYIVFFNH